MKNSTAEPNYDRSLTPNYGQAANKQCESQTPNDERSQTPNSILQNLQLNLCCIEAHNNFGLKGQTHIRLYKTTALVQVKCTNRKS